MPRLPKALAAERAEAIQQLREWYPAGSTVYTILRHVSRSGMARTIGMVALLGPEDIRHPNFAVGTALGLRVDRERDGVKISGGGMDMGFAIVDDLASVLDYPLNHRRL